MWSTTFLCLAGMAVRADLCWGSDLKAALRADIHELHPRPPQAGSHLPISVNGADVQGVTVSSFQGRQRPFPALPPCSFCVCILHYFYLINCSNPKVRAKITWHWGGSFGKQIQNSSLLVWKFKKPALGSNKTELYSTFSHPPLRHWMLF